MSDRGVRSGDPWQAVLDDGLAASAREIVNEIAVAIGRRAPSHEPGLKGEASAALLLAHHGAADAAARLEAALTASTSGPLTMSLFGGASGVSWIVGQLAEGPEADAVIEHLDAALWRHLDVSRWDERHDLMSGLAGVGVLVADRRDDRARRIAERVLSHLEATALHSDAGATWRTPPQFLPDAQRAQFSQGMIDVGVAHGAPGVIGMLAQFVEAGIEPERSRRLLASAVAWLVDALPPRPPRFGTSWPLDRDRAKRIGWCYGDPGVAGVLLGASRALGSASVEAVALGLLRDLLEMLARWEPPDAGFCHGAAGLAHIYNVAFQRTGDPQLRAEAVRWLREVMRMRAPGTGIAGYAALQIDGEAPRWEDDATLLSGAVGIALVLLAAIEDREPSWQRLFVL